MALSNMLREPRREITETVLGLFFFVLLFGGDYLLVHLLQNTGRLRTGGGATFLEMILAPLLIFIVGLLLLLILMAIHGIGDGLCEWLGDYGLDPRPKRRY